MIVKALFKLIFLPLRLALGLADGLIGLVSGLVGLVFGLVSGLAWLTGMGLLLLLVSAFVRRRFSW